MTTVFSKRKKPKSKQPARKTVLVDMPDIGDLFADIDRSDLAREATIARQMLTATLGNRF